MGLVGITRPRAGAAHRITTAAEARRVAADLAEEFRRDSSVRDAERVLPIEELTRLSASGLLGVFVPASHGGADLSVTEVAEIFRVLATADPNIAQIPHSHFVYVNVLCHQGTPEQQQFFFGEVLAGKRFGNAQSETGTRHVQDIRTTLRPSPAAGTCSPASRDTARVRCSPTGSRCSPISATAGRCRWRMWSGTPPA